MSMLMLLNRAILSRVIQLGPNYGTPKISRIFSILTDNNLPGLI